MPFLVCSIGGAHDIGRPRSTKRRRSPAPALGIPVELRRAGGLEGLNPSHLRMAVKPIRLHPRGIVDRVKAVA
jgi:hypothetical protein